MRVSLFGLFLRGTSLMEPWPKPVRSVLLVISFIRLYQFYVSLGDIWCCLVYFIYRLFTCSYHFISCMFLTWYRLLSLYLLLHACAHDPVFNACLWFGFIDTHVLIYARHLAFTSPLAEEFWLLWILMSRSQSLQRVDSPSCWPEKCSGSVNLQQTVQSPILPGPLLGYRVFLLWLWVSFCNVHTCTSPYILVFAPYWWCNIIVILCQILW